MMNATEHDLLISLLGGWPASFGDEEISHGKSLLAFLARDRIMNEPVFGLVIRYAIHRAAFDRFSIEISEEEFTATASNYLSGKEQSRAFHENKLLVIERELIATPYARAKSGQTTQTSFMDMLDEQPPEDGGSGKVMPFKPLAKRGSASQKK